MMKARSMMQNKKRDMGEIDRDKM